MPHRRAAGTRFRCWQTSPAGRRRWSLLVAAWFGTSPLVFWALYDPEVLPQILSDSVPDLALLAAVLLLGEAVRTRRALDREHRLLVAEQERSERLLLNVLPAPIAARLMQGEEPIADGFGEVTVLFADLVDFTRRSQPIAPAQVVQFLNELFSTFDRLADRYRLEKIKTIGDAYMVAGVIGRHKFIYDLWGDTVNTASRMGSQGVTGCIQVTARTWERLRASYRFERRGSIQVKGKGRMVTYFLVDRSVPSA